MKIMICCSKYFYDKIPEIKENLERQNHEIILPNCYDDPFKEERIKKISLKNHVIFKEKMFTSQLKKIKSSNAILVLNYNKNGQSNYIGGSTFLEMYEAWKSNKKIFLYNSIPKNLLEDEIIGMHPVILNKNLTKISKDDLG